MDLVIWEDHAQLTLVSPQGAPQRTAGPMVPQIWSLIAALDLPPGVARVPPSSNPEDGPSQLDFTVAQDLLGPQSPRPPHPIPSQVAKVWAAGGSPHLVFHAELFTVWVSLVTFQKLPHSTDLG